LDFEEALKGSQVLKIFFPRPILSPEAKILTFSNKNGHSWPLGHKFGPRMDLT
jgi:hypothetical protein